MTENHKDRLEDRLKEQSQTWKTSSIILETLISHSWTWPTNWGGYCLYSICLILARSIVFIIDQFAYPSIYSCFFRIQSWNCVCVYVNWSVFYTLSRIVRNCYIIWELIIQRFIECCQSAWVRFGSGLGAFINRLSAQWAFCVVFFFFFWMSRSRSRSKQDQEDEKRRWRSWPLRSWRALPVAGTSTIYHLPSSYWFCAYTLDNMLDLFGVSYARKNWDFITLCVFFFWACLDNNDIYESGYCFYLFFHLGVLQQLVEYDLAANSISITCKFELYVNAAFPLFTLFYQPNLTT